MMIYPAITIDGVTRPLRQSREFCLRELDQPATPAFRKEAFDFFLEYTGDREKVQLTTSGTTGRPVVLTARKEQLAASARLTLHVLGLQPGDKALLCLPARYIAGRMMIVRAITGGLDLHLTRPTVRPQIREHYDFSAMTPQQAGNILHTSGGRQKLTRIKKLLLGGGPLPSGLEKELSSLPTEIFHTYGMTETFSHIALRRITGPDRSPLFSPLPGVRVSLSNEGTLIIQAPHLLQDPVHTHDLAVIDPQGRFRITGRSDNLINTGGVKVSPEILEEQLQDKLSFPFFIGGLEDPLLGEKVVLFMQGPTPDPPALEEIRKAVRSLPDRTGRPRQLVISGSFSYTPTGKLRRQESMKIAEKKGVFYDL